MKILQHIVLVLGLLFIAVLVQGLSWHWWFETFVVDRIHAIVAGIHLDVLIEQVPTMLSFLFLGAVGFFVFESSWALWTIFFGAAGSLFRAAMTQAAFVGTADLSEKLNYFATYAYPPLFALLGATLVWLVFGKRGTPLTRLQSARRVRRIRR